MGADTMAQLASPPPASTSISYGCQFVSLLVNFPSSSLVETWESNEGWIWFTEFTPEETPKVNSASGMAHFPILLTDALLD